MPVMGGLDAIKLHRFASGGRDDPPFVALTADATDETRRQCQRRGIDAYLTKPVEVEELLSLVDRLTRPGRRRRPRPVRTGAGGGPRPRRGATTLPVLDRSCLERLRQLDDQEDDFLARLINDFLADAEQLVAEIEAAAAAATPTTFRDRAHALRSSAAHVGATALFELCLGWRGIGREELAEQRRRATSPRLRSEFERLRTALLAELAAPSPREPAASAGGTDRCRRGAAPPPGSAVARCCAPPDAPSAGDRPRRARARSPTQSSVTSISSS